MSVSDSVFPPVSACLSLCLRLSIFLLACQSLCISVSADDTELYKSDSPSEAFTLSRTIEARISDVKVWAVQNKLKLNDDKTKIVLIVFARGIDLPSSVRVGQSYIYFTSAARNFGVIFDSELALKEQMNKLCQLVYLEIRRIGSIQQYLSVEATKTIVSSLVLSRLDYCNALLAGCPQVLLDKIRRVINCSFASSTKFQNLLTLLLYSLTSTGCRSTAGCNTK